MQHRLRYRFWLESIMGGIAALAAFVTVFWSAWIEMLVGVDPDSDSGAAEWLVVGGLGLITLALGVCARQEWRTAHMPPTASEI